MNEISSSSIRDAISKEDDFGHEMRVGNVLRSCSGAVVEHGGTYTDSVTEKPRQFDYRAWLKKQQKRLSLAVECKNLSPTTPLVVCGTSRNENEAFHDLIESRQGTFSEDSLIKYGLSSVTWRVKSANTFYSKGEFVGKSLLRVQADKTTTRSGESEIYDKWAQALSSAVELATAATSLAKHLSTASVFSAVLPVVVIPNGILWKVTYDLDGTMVSDPECVDECAFFVGREIDIGGPKGTPFFQKFTFSHVHFFTLEGLDSFLSAMVRDDNTWDKLFAQTNNAAKISAAYPADPAKA